MKIFFIFPIYMMSAVMTDAVATTICEHESYSMHCNTGSSIEVIRVFYGRANNVTCFPHWSMGNYKNPCFAQNALDVVAKKCNGLQTCDITAGNSVFGDPCPMVFKYFEIEYICSGFPMVSVDTTTVAEGTTRAPDYSEFPMVVCEHESFRMNCIQGLKIEVIRAFYGRANNQTCFPHWSMGNYKSPCFAQNALEVVARKCNGLQTCDIQASNTVFSDPCPNVFKYLGIDFTCNQ